MVPRVRRRLAREEVLGFARARARYSKATSLVYKSVEVDLGGTVGGFIWSPQHARQVAEAMLRAADDAEALSDAQAKMTDEGLSGAERVFP